MAPSLGKLQHPAEGLGRNTLLIGSELIVRATNLSSRELSYSDRYHPPKKPLHQSDRSPTAGYRAQPLAAPYAHAVYTVGDSLSCGVQPWIALVFPARDLQQWPQRATDWAPKCADAATNL